MHEIAKKHEGDIRQFIILSQAWYSETTLTKEQREAGEDQIMVGFYCPDGGTSGEFEIRWEPLQGGIVARIHAFDDAWSAMAGFIDVIQKLGNLTSEIDAPSPTVEQVVEILKSCGVVDATDRVSPYAEPKPSEEDIAASAEVLRVYLQGLNRIRELGRAASGNPDWAKDAENGEGIIPSPKISQAIWQETKELAQTVRTKRQMLMAIIKDNGDDSLLEKHRDILLG